MAMIDGTSGNDILIGTPGDDTINGLIGADTMQGLGGNDIYIVDNAGDIVIEAVGEGIDRINTTVSYTLGATAEIEILSAAFPDSPGTINLTGNDFANSLWGSAGNNILTGGGGDDFLFGFGGVDQLFAGTGNDFLDAGNDNVLDLLLGGIGDDIYITYGSDQVLENAGEGLDRAYVTSSLSLQETSELEIMIAADGTANVFMQGNNFVQSFFGNAGNNTIIAGGGGDTVLGYGGDDTINGGDGNDLLLGGDGNDIFNGGNDSDVIYGEAGSDTLDGGAGFDTLYGGIGDDTYYVTEHDVVIELDGEGTDIVVSNFNYALNAGSYVERLIASEIANPTNLTGNELGNDIRGNSQGNILDGAGGDDYLVGNDGRDTLIGGLGKDTLEGGTGLDWLYGGDGNDTLLAGEPGNIGGGDSDYLDGGSGADVMVGGSYRTTFVVDNAGDVIGETTAGSGESTRDRVYAQVSYVLTAGAFVEEIYAADQVSLAPIDLGGNETDNVIVGSAGVNVLSGGDGNDTLFGREGNDFLNGDGGNDYLDGGLGADRMTGGTGDDTYIVNSFLDTIVESAGGGVDRVYVDLSYTLTGGAAVELLIASGQAALDLTGNELDNQVYGNNAINALGGGAGNDTLLGLGGNDALNGGLGDDVLDGGLDIDTLTGGAGADLFLFTTAVASGNADRITDFQSGVDKIALSSAVFDGLSVGALPDAAFHSGAAAADADDRIIFDPQTGMLYFDPDGNGEIAPIHFATLQPGVTPTASDFGVF